MTNQTRDRRRALAFNAVGPALKAHEEWVPLSVRRAVADAVLAAVDTQSEPPADPASKVSLRKAGVDLATAQASRERWRREYAELASQHRRVRSELEASQRRGLAFIERIDAARTWARRNLPADQQTALLTVLRGDEQPHPTDCRCACDGCRHHNASPVPEPRDEYAAGVEAAIGLNVNCGGSDGVQRVRDAVLAVRDLELEQAQASRERWRQEVLELVEQVKTLNASLAALHEGEEEATSIRLSGPTPGEWLWFWNRASASRRLEVAAEVIDAGMRAGTCFQADHEGTIERLRATLEPPKDQP
ncbi:hypothetical protein [Streptomyces sp. NPDC096339]|uniref:hypothetical protein n=1 Tax=Streptomyces sp. NPDC096339 TaxID=3366086 RepID=UPI0038044528